MPGYYDITPSDYHSDLGGCGLPSITWFRWGVMGDQQNWIVIVGEPSTGLGLTADAVIDNYGNLVMVSK